MLYSLLSDLLLNKDIYYRDSQNSELDTEKHTPLGITQPLDYVLYHLTCRYTIKAIGLSA